MQLLGRGWFCLVTMFGAGPIVAALVGFLYAWAAGLSRASVAKSGDDTLWYAMLIGGVVLWLIHWASLFCWYRFGKGASGWAASGAVGRSAAVFFSMLAGATTSLVTSWFWGAVVILLAYGKYYSR